MPEEHEPSTPPGPGGPNKRRLIELMLRLAIVLGTLGEIIVTRCT